MFWSIIAANKRKTVLLVILMGILLTISGAVIGMAFVGIYNLYAGISGAVIAFAVWMIMLLMSVYASDSMLLGIAEAKEVDRDTYPQLYNVVEEMVIAGSLPAMPKVYIVDDPAPNAFAVGKSPQNSHVCVTAGLLAVCNRDELQGVVAHEIGHIMNRDVLYMTVAATMLGSIIMISEVFLRSFRYSTVRFTSRSRRIRGKGAGVILLVSLVLTILAPVLARILYYTISRKREYLADATSARLTRYPEGLASALDKIGNSPDKLVDTQSVTAPFYIVNPKIQRLNDSIFATHPPLHERIMVLRAMSHGAGYLDYMKAYIKVTRRRKSLIPAADLKTADKVELRAPQAISPVSTQSEAENKRRAGDIIRAMNLFSFITCPCGLRLKVPPEYPDSRIACPRCNRVHDVPKPNAKTKGAIMAASSAMNSISAEYPGSLAPVDGITREQLPQSVQINPGRWQRFACSACGHPYEISPGFGGRKLVCSGCGSVILFSRAPTTEN